MSYIENKAPMRVLMLTRKIDQGGSLHGFVHSWVTALAQRIEKLDVIAQEYGEADLPSNVTVMSLGKEQGIPKPQQWINSQKYIWPSVKNVDLVFAHMRPRYVLASMTPAFLNRVPTVLWYTLGRDDLKLQISHKTVKRVVSATHDSNPLEGEKVIPIGHGINFERFVPSSDLIETPRTVLTVGSLTPWKGIETLIEVAAKIKADPNYADVNFVWVGGVRAYTPEGYRDFVLQKIEACGVADRFTLVDTIPFSEMQKYYDRAAVAVSLSETGSTDKTVLEGMGCGVPTLATGTVYSDVLYDLPRFLAKERDVDDITAKLTALLSLTAQERRDLGMQQRSLAVEKHDLQSMMDRLVGVFETVLEESR